MMHPAILGRVLLHELFALVQVVCGASLNKALAQESNDGAAARVATASALHTAEPVVERYLVTYLKSRTDAPHSDLYGRQGYRILKRELGKCLQSHRGGIPRVLTTGETSDTGVAAVSNPKIVRAGQGNRGD